MISRISSKFYNIIRIFLYVPVRLKLSSIFRYYTDIPKYIYNKLNYGNITLTHF